MVALTFCGPSTADEINALRKEALEMRNLRLTLNEPGAAKRVFDKVYKQDIERLLSMDEMWRNRKRPTALAYEEASQTPHSTASSTSLRDQTRLGLRETVEMFERSLDALAKRSASSANAEPLSFDKDDNDTLDFVTASSNLRSRVYSIETKTRFDVKQMAGNIIPAIASTNAIISGALVLQSLHLLQRECSKARDVMLGRSVRFILSGTEPGRPNPLCGVCADVYVPVQISDTRSVTLGDLLERAKLSRDEGGLGLTKDLELGVYEGSRLLADPDFEENLNKPLSSLGIDAGKFLAFVDEDGAKATIQLVVTPLPEDGADTSSTRNIVFPAERNLPTLKDRPVHLKAAEKLDDDDGSDIVRAVGASDDDDERGFEIDEERGNAERHQAAAAAAVAATKTSKRLAANADKSTGDEAQTTKKRRLEATKKSEADGMNGHARPTSLADANAAADGDEANKSALKKQRTFS